MKKAQLIQKIKAKKGFHSIIKDELAPDHVQGDPIQKRFFYVNHVNADGTAGKTYVFYLWDEATDDAWFYNMEAEAVDAKEPSSDQKKLSALQNYLKANFNAYFVIRADLENNWAEADTYKLETGKLTYKKVMVFKQGSSPISHLEIV